MAGQALGHGRAGGGGVPGPADGLAAALVHRSLSALLAQLQARDLLEAAATLGVPPVRALRQVVLPLLAPGLAAR